MPMLVCAHTHMCTCILCCVCLCMCVCVMFAKDLNYTSVLAVSSLDLRPKANAGSLITSNRGRRQMQGWSWDKGLVRISSFYRFKIIELLVPPCALPGLIIHSALSCLDSVLSLFGIKINKLENLYFPQYKFQI